MSLNFVAFADHVFIRSIYRIKREAEAMNVFKNIFCWTETDLDPDFKNRHHNMLQPNIRGFGYWIWKPQVVLQALKRLEYGDFLLYADSGCQLNTAGRSRLLQYVQMATDDPSGICVFDELNTPECEWTKMDLFAYLDFMKPEQLSSKQLGASTFLLKKTPENVQLVEKYQQVCENYHMIDDSPSVLPNHLSYNEHRHDQSVFSILFKKNGCVKLPNETYFNELWDGYDHFPVHVKRLRFKDLYM